LKADGHPESTIDDTLFVIECLALRCGHKSYLKDVNKRLVKYLDAGCPLPPGMNQHLSTQLKCIANGEDATNVFFITGGKGTKTSHSLRNLEVYNFLSSLDGSEYSLKGGRKKKSKIEYAAKFFFLSESTIKTIYEEQTKKEKILKACQNDLKKKNERRVLEIIINDFRKYQADGGDMQLIDYAEERLGLKNYTQK